MSAIIWNPIEWKPAERGRVLWHSEGDGRAWQDPERDNTVTLHCACGHDDHVYSDVQTFAEAQELDKLAELPCSTCRQWRHGTRKPVFAFDGELAVW